MILVSSDSGNALGDQIADRHAGTLGGRLRELGDLALLHVEVSVSATSARSFAGQQLVIQIANLAGRLHGVVGALTFRVDGGDVSLMSPDVIPHAAESLLTTATRIASLTTTLSAPMAEMQLVRVRIGAIGRGSSASTRAEIFAAATDWNAVVSSLHHQECELRATLPFGAFAAAALVVARIFHIGRGPEAVQCPARTLWFSTWSWQLSDRRLREGPSRDDIRRQLPHSLPEFVLVGVGAVGSAFLLTLGLSGLELYAGTIIDGDNISLTNLNRYALFGLHDVGLGKAARARELLCESRISRFSLTSESMWWADYARSQPHGHVEYLISAVDTNGARWQLQDALPHVILAGSTFGMRAQVNRYYLHDDASPCLKCYNAVEVLETDESLHHRLLRLSGEQVAAEAQDRGVDPLLMSAFVNDLRSGGTGCGLIHGDMLAKLRRNRGEGQFAVSFVSFFAGAMLAAQFVRESLGMIFLVPKRSRGHFQFWKPRSRSNTSAPTAPETTCWCQTSGIRATHNETWQRSAD